MSWYSDWYSIIYLYWKHRLILQYKYLATSTCILQFNINKALTKFTPLISCVNSPEFLFSVLSELPFGISASTFCLCLEIGHLDEGRHNFLKVEAKSYPLGVRISMLDFLVSISYLPVTHLTTWVNVLSKEKHYTWRHCVNFLYILKNVAKVTEVTMS